MGDGTVLAASGASWCRAASQRLPGSCQDASRCLRATQSPKCYGMSSYVDEGRPALGAHRHSGTDPRNSQRARRVALACEVVSEDHITRSNTARGAIADSDFHLPHENKNVLSPGRGVPIAPIVCREIAEHKVGTRLKRNVVALLGRPEEDLQNGSGRRGPYISVRSCASSFPQRDHRKGVLRVIADDETSGILAPHASTGQVGGKWDIQQGNGFFECM